MNIISKTLSITLIIIATTLIAIIFGVFHNQISYSISNELFEKYFFFQFGTSEWNINNPRINASIVGFLGTYWLSFYFGIIYSIIFLFLKTPNNLKYIFKSIGINFSITLIGSFLGYLIAILFFDIENVPFKIEIDIINTRNYINAMFMHSGAYYGSYFGIVISIIYLINKNKKVIKIRQSG